VFLRPAPPEPSSPLSPATPFFRPSTTNNINDNNKIPIPKGRVGIEIASHRSTSVAFLCRCDGRIGGSRRRRRNGK